MILSSLYRYRNWARPQNWLVVEPEFEPKLICSRTCPPSWQPSCVVNHFKLTSVLRSKVQPVPGPQKETALTFWSCNGRFLYSWKTLWTILYVGNKLSKHDRALHLWKKAHSGSSKGQVGLGPHWPALTTPYQLGQEWPCWSCFR